jgi:outer membrane protein, heavy metal efflux system
MRSALCALLLAALLPCPALAQQASGHTMPAGRRAAPPSSLDALLDAALPHHPMLRAEHSMASERRAMSRTSALRPDATLSVSAQGLPWTSPWLGTSMMAGVEVSVMQPLWWSGELLAQQESQLARASAQDARADEARVRLIAEAADLYYQLYTIDRVVKAMQDTRAPLDDMRALLTARLSTGGATVAQIERVNLASVRLDDEILMLLHERPGKEAALNALLQRPPDSPITPVLDPRLDGNVDDLDALVQRGMAQRPFIGAAQAELRASRADLDAARFEAWPRLAVMGGWMFRAAGAPMGQHSEADDGTDYLMLGVQSSIPWSAPRRAESMADAAQARMVATRAQLDAFELNLRAQLAGQHAELEHLARHIAFYQDTLLPQARRTRDATLIGIQSGERELDGWFEAEMALRESYVRLARLDASLRRQHAMILATIDALYHGDH